MTRKWHLRGESSEHSTTGRKLRSVVLVAALTTLSTAGGLATASSALSAPAPGQNLGICHATHSNTNPYVYETPNINATGLQGGHANHIGPIWDPTLKAQHIHWGDIIPPFTYQPKKGPAVNYPGLNWTAAGQQILANGCAIPDTVTPADPTVTQSACLNGVPTKPNVVLQSTPGIVYSINPSSGWTAGSTATVTATAASAGDWFQPPAPAGWTYVDLTHETFAITFTAAPNCVIVASPDDPTVTQSVCNGGTATAPDVTLPTTTGIVYTVNPTNGWTAGGTATVTATAQAGYQFTSAPAGWTLVDSTHETFAITFTAAPICNQVSAVTPIDPTVTQSVCNSDHNPTQPDVTLPNTAGIVYTVNPNSGWTAGGTATVTATAQAGFDFTSAPAGWTLVDSTHETFAITFNAAPQCKTTVAPADPTVTQSVCDLNVPTAPGVTLATTPGITYSVNPSSGWLPGGTATVTALADFGAGDEFVAPAPAGWTFVDSTHETFAVSFTNTVGCTNGAGGVDPENPSVTQASCSNGQLVDPTLTTAVTAGVVYSVSAAAPYAPGQSITLTATADSSHAFAAPAPAGWTFVDTQHDTYALTFTNLAACDQGLANTGVASSTMLGWGGAVLGIGLLLQFVGMRRRQQKATDAV